MRAKSANKGFTLVELLVAAVLIATGLAAAAAAFSAATRAQAAALRTTTAARLAEAKLTEIQAAATISGNAEGTFAELETEYTPGIADLGDYHYRWEVTTDESTGLARAQVWVWYRDNQQNPFTLVCYLTSGEAAS